MSLNKIYSRPRIRFIKLPKNKPSKLKMVIFWAIFIIILCIILFIRAAYPVFIATCENAATSAAVNILTKEVNEAIMMYSYNDLVNIEKDESGKISYIEAKIMPINQLVSDISNNIQRQIDGSSTITVDLNFGSVSGISCLSIISPHIKLTMEKAGGIEADVKSEFTSVGINQTLHRIYLNLQCDIGILTPFETLNRKVQTEVLLTETVIVGEVPETYYNYDNLGFTDVLQTLE